NPGVQHRLSAQCLADLLNVGYYVDEGFILPGQLSRKRAANGAEPKKESGQTRSLQAGFACQAALAKDKEEEKMEEVVLSSSKSEAESTDS
ncbi:hypothetical protein JCM11641_003116, partial [Rhodosporidiobolus odoratus]